MRRLLAYLVMMLTAIGAIVFNVQSVLEKTNDGMEFGRGTELVFSLEKRNVDDYDSTYYPTLYADGTEQLSEIDIAEEVMDRLDVAGVRNADVQVVEGNSETEEGYELRVTMSPLSENELNNVKQILGETGTLSVGTFGDDYIMSQDAGQFFATDKDVAEVVYDGTTPYVAINLNSDTDFQTMKDQASQAGTNHEDDTVAGEDSSSDSDEDSDSSDTRGTTLYLWTNKMIDDTFDRAYGVNDTVVMQETKDKVLAELDVSNYDADKLQITLTSDMDGNAFTISSARAFVNTLNATDYGFNIQFLYQNAVQPAFGNGAINLTYLLVGVFLGIASIALILFFGLSGLTGAVTMCLSVFGSLWLVTSLGFEFSVATLVGLLVIASLSAFLSVNYFTHVRRESKIRPDLEKANREGYRQGFFIGLDSAVVVLIVSLFGFLFATGHFQTFFGTIMIGSIVTFFATNYLNKWATYWLTKGSKMGVRPAFALLPEGKKERKAIAFVSAKKGACSHKVWPIFAGVSLALLAIALPLTQAFGGNGFTIFNNSGSYEEGYTLSIQYRMDLESYERLQTSERFLSYLQEIGKPSEGTDNSYVAVPADSEEAKDVGPYGFVYYPETASLNTLERNDQEGNDYYLTYFSVDVDRDLSAMKLQDEQLLTNFIHESIAQRVITVENVTISLGNDAHFVSSSLLVGAYVLSPTNVYHSSVNLFLLVFLLPVLAAIYVLLRYGLLLGLGELATGEIFSALSVGLLSATRIPFNSYSAFGVLAGFVLVLFFVVPLLGKNKVILKERGIRRTADAETRAAITNAEADEAVPVLSVVSLVSILLAAMFFFLNVDTIALAGIEILAVVFAGLTLLLFTLPFYHFLSTHISFATINRKLEERREKKGVEKAKPAKDGIVYVDQDAPHETIIVGLNDFRR